MDFLRLINQVDYKAVRSSGSGGQHVNKVATKIELYFDFEASQFFNEEEKNRLREFLQNRLTKSGILILSCGETRSQLKNKNRVTKRFYELLEEGLKEEKERKPTKIPKAVKRKRLANKKRNSEKKANRKPPKID
ncbi:aminoacyl-tRNA hydrolase [Winogradskyella sp. PC-19]|uniref:alternative ribosome rescue aminoacyl-tRNA hydrolase ArfB n=1 Tax=unclassified Winogradskyella TaxID=2615021 RepID=UPI000B3D14F5|nr:MULTISPECIES: alternative ribosome rescue aminoacyl-tRNA hydrolase ArfB [unclassified Winogradskyella]ARV09995.1 aminoacyl-tRNA hydrolase [Winogradskyella sp. PC-19]RZN83601.1 MAG: aminoacyl-tRNA hydrolase [Winogradskyella sp.]